MAKIIKDFEKTRSDLNKVIKSGFRDGNQSFQVSPIEKIEGLGGELGTTINFSSGSPLPNLPTQEGKIDDIEGSMIKIPLKTSQKTDI